MDGNAGYVAAAYLLSAVTLGVYVVTLVRRLRRAERSLERTDD